MTDAGGVYLAGLFAMSLMTRIAGRCRASRLVPAFACLLSLFALCQAEAMAMDIAILKSSGINAYEQAIEGFKATAPSGTIYTEYDLQGDLEQGRKLARKIRASDTSLVVAVGLKAALAAKLEIVDTPVVYMMILDPLKHYLNASNMTGTLLEIPAERQFKILRSFLPNVRRLGSLSSPGNSSGKFKEASAQASAQGFQLQDFPVESE